MAFKKLAAADVATLTEMVMNGVPPADLADRFKVSISSIHNYKRELKQGGLALPDVRGRRPTGQFDASKVPVEGALPMMLSSHQGHTGAGAIFPHEGEQQSQQAAYVTFIINGLRVQVDARASSVRVENGTVIVEF